MTQQVIAVGTSANDNTGDPIRTAFIKTNANFSELYTRAYGAFQSVLTQTCSASTATAMRFEIVDIDDGVDISNLTDIVLPNPGVYNLQFSIQTRNTGSASDPMYIWLRQNGVDIPGSAGKVNIAGTQGGGSGELIVGWNFFIRTTSANEHVNIMWFTADETHVQIAAFPAQSATGTTPSTPSTASIVLTVNQVN